MAECGRRLNAGSATGYSSAAEVLPRLPGWPRTESGPEPPPAEPRRGELDAANLRGSNDVAGDADDKQVAQTLIEDHLCRDSRIGTPEDDGELLLTCRQLAAARLAPEYVAAPSARNEVTVSFSQAFERFASCDHRGVIRVCLAPCTTFEKTPRPSASMPRRKALNAIQVQMVISK